MNSAAQGNFLQVLSFLHEISQHIECSVAAMDGAARNGHLGIVEWLHRHRTEG
jgi:hypothetical protein